MILCPLCKGPMRKYGEDSFYNYWRCQDKRCKNEHMTLLSDRPGKIGKDKGEE